MRDHYSPGEFEAKWRERWEAAKAFRTREEPGRPKFYGLDFFPYPSGAGLSVGHCRNYVPTDVLCRMKFMQGYNVLHPMGFDAFGLPAENEAIKRKTHPAPMIDEYAGTYERQMKLIGVSYDWERSFKSSDPDYYRWTQWMFTLLHQRGLAYRKLAEVNWCPKDKTALANEEVVGGLCERCGTPVEKRAIPQWFFRITEYAQRLIDGLDTVDWPEGIKQMQRNWIGRSEGVEFTMAVEVEPGAEVGDDGDEGLSVRESPLEVRVFTTRVDTVFGVTFCVVAPEHPVVKRVLGRAGQERREAVEAYVASAKRLSDTDRQAEGREKTGVFLGAHAVNPLTDERIPIYVADYVLMGYGTGAIMAVPGHDQRDFDFAKAHGVEVRTVIAPAGAETPTGPDADRAFEAKDGVLVNSGAYSGMPVAEAQRALGEWFEQNELGERKVNYKLRDWLISRQRYWGCPIPVCYSAEGDEMLIPVDQLPVELPKVESYEPGDDGSSPLAGIPEFVNCTTPEGTLGRRETDTMGGFACSSWYFLRFCDPHNPDQAWDPGRVAYWMPVDAYVGGAEHAVMHLLYARFWTKVLYDAGLVPVEEPFQRLMNQGQVLGHTPYRQAREGETLGVGEDGVLVSFAEAAALPEGEVTWRWVRMSKSKGNVVTPDEAVAQFGADSLRLYELFVAPFEADVQWSNEGMNGTSRFLSRVFRLVSDLHGVYDPAWRSRIGGEELSERARALRRVTHKLVKKATEDIERFAFNTYVSAMMETLNAYNDLRKGSEPDARERLAWSEALESLVLVLSPGAPHSADEMWEGLGHEGFTYHADWPAYDAEIARDETVTVAVQVNGKLRDTVEVAADASQADLEAAALASAKVQAFIDGKQVRKVIVVPGKLVNVVVG